MITTKVRIITNSSNLYSAYVEGYDEYIGFGKTVREAVKELASLFYTKARLMAYVGTLHGHVSTGAEVLTNLGNKLTKLEQSSVVSIKRVPYNLLITIE